MADSDQQLSLHAAEYLNRARALIAELAEFDAGERIEVINELRRAIHEHSPMRDEPVDYVRWVPAEQVTGNTWNPNSVAPPEMRLLEHSITQDGYTQPIVAWPTPGSDDSDRPQGYEVVDGFHRHLVGRRSSTVRERVRGHLPIAAINAQRQSDEDRKAATVRHNRARGEHNVEDMAKIVIDLYRSRKRNPLQYVCTELGMDAEEVNRLRMQAGLGEAYADQEFSRAWDVKPLDLHDELDDVDLDTD